MTRLVRGLVLATFTVAIVAAFAIPAFANHPGVPCGQYPPNPNCPSQSRGHRGGAPGLNQQTVGQGGPGDFTGAAANSAATSTSSAPGNSGNAPGHTGANPGQSGTAGNSAQAHGNHTGTTIPGVLTPGGVLLIGGLALTVMWLRRRNRRLVLGR